MATRFTEPSPLFDLNGPLTGAQIDEIEKKAASLNSNRKLRIAIITENFLPKIDGVTRTLAMLLEHLEKEGHEALVLGPESGMTSYAGHEVVGTWGLPLLGVYKGLALNWIRPRFIRKLAEFKPDVIQVVDPIWLCSQAIPVVQYFFPDTPLLASYHTNLAGYATLFGFPWLTPVMWSLQRKLHAQCKITFCPSQSTARMLKRQGLDDVRIWPRGVDTSIFRPSARDFALRQSWGAEPSTPQPSALPLQSSFDSLPPAYTASESQSKVVCLYVGRLSWEKNLRLLVEAFRGLEDRCRLVFVGDGPARAEMEALCESYGLEALFMGFRKGAELAGCYASADLFCFPSHTETFGQVVLESLASGLPVVGLRAEGVCDLVSEGETGLMLDMDDLTEQGQEKKESFRLATKTPPNSPPSYTPQPHFRPLPENPHALVGSDAPTFPAAVKVYRSLIEELVVDHGRRREMGRRAALEAGKKTWHGAMEMLVDGFRELTHPLEVKLDTKISSNDNGLTLSRASTLELDVVEHSVDDALEVDSTASSSSSQPRKTRVGTVLRLGGSVLRRTRFQDQSDEKPIRKWLGEKGRLIPSSLRHSTLAGEKSDVSALNAAEQAQALKLNTSDFPFEAMGLFGIDLDARAVTWWVIRVALLLWGMYVLSGWVAQVERPTFGLKEITYQDV